MMKILTPEQMRVPLERGELNFVTPRELHAICEAQAKLTLQEVVAWLEEHSFDGMDIRTYGYRLIRLQDWQKLKEMANV